MYHDLLEKGYAALRRGDPEAARVRFQHAIEAEPERPQGYFGLAQTYIDQNVGGEVEVIEALEKALEVDPHYVPARAFLGIELLKRYDTHGAEEELQRALEEEPTNLLAHVKYAEYYYRLGFYNRAVEMLEQGLQGPHGANEHVVALARRFLIEARLKCRAIIIREPPDPRPLRLMRLFSRFKPTKKVTETA
ncbi:MAG TPA: tetratricopeptide repeat protein [Ktedonobacteraceae bacterium]